jgi:hypothetical protein
LSSTSVDLPGLDGHIAVGGTRRSISAWPPVDVLRNARLHRWGPLGLFCRMLRSAGSRRRCRPVGRLGQASPILGSSLSSCCLWGLGVSRRFEDETRLRDCPVFSPSCFLFFIRSVPWISGPVSSHLRTDDELNRRSGWHNVFAVSSEAHPTAVSSQINCEPSKFPGRGLAAMKGPFGSEGQTSCCPSASFVQTRRAAPLPRGLFQIPRFWISSPLGTFMQLCLRNPRNNPPTTFLTREWRPR